MRKVLAFLSLWLVMAISGCVSFWMPVVSCEQVTEDWVKSHGQTEIRQTQLSKLEFALVAIHKTENNTLVLTPVGVLAESDYEQAGYVNKCKFNDKEFYFQILTVIVDNGVMTSL
jgi:hypothetical protein